MRVKGAETPISQGLQYPEEDIVLRDRYKRSTESTPFSDRCTNGNYAPAGQVQIVIYSTNIQYIPVAPVEACKGGSRCVGARGSQREEGNLGRDNPLG